MSQNKFVSVAIDFGTTYSGYAFSTRHEPKDIKTFRWFSAGYDSVKTPTSILFDPNKNFHSFGFEAEDRFASLSRSGDENNWFFFKQFKLTLHKTKDLSTLTEIPSIGGAKMLALDVFSGAIRYLKDHLLRQSQGQFRAGDVQWVLTVPAIWEDKARQFMRQAAIKAGIPDSDLTLALEPEAASVYCRGAIPDMQHYMSRGYKYLVLDCGGGTVDIAVHKIEFGGKLRAVYRPTGGVWGGIKVDDAFQMFLWKNCGRQSIEDLTKHQMLEMQRSFERAKKRVKSSSSASIVMSLPLELRETLQTGPSCSLRQDKVRLSADLMRSFFEKPVKKIVEHVEGLLEDPSVNRVRAIFMVGGFSESEILQTAIQQRFPGIRVHVPDQADSAVLRGAVIQGHEPHIIGWRKSPYTYGFDVCMPFNETIHDRSKRAVYEGKPYCNGIFDRLVAINDTVEVGKTSETRSYLPAVSDQDSIVLILCRSPEESPMYVTDAGCEQVGSLQVYLTSTTGSHEKYCDITVRFGEAELVVEAVDRHSKRQYKAEFNFLST